MALVHGLAVTAAPVQLSEVVDGEAGDRQAAAAVVLEDLVVGAESAAAGDGGGVAGLLLLDGEGVLAHGGPPDVLELAVAEAVHALGLVGADDDVGERGAFLEDEDGVAVAALRLPRAVDATVVDEHATVEALAGGDRLDGVQRRATRGGWDAATGGNLARGQGGRGGGERGAGGASAGTDVGAVAGAELLAVVVVTSSGAEGESQDCELSVLHLDEDGSKMRRGRKED